MLQIGEYYIKMDTITFAHAQSDGIAFKTACGSTGFVARTEPDYPAFLAGLGELTKG